MSHHPTITRWLSGCALLCSAAHATDGYFQNGYSTRSSGAGGVGIALPQDAVAGAYNPAATAWLHRRLDIGLSAFVPDRSATIHGNPLASGHYGGNGSHWFPIPEFGWSRPLPHTLSVGIAAYANGGMNTTYRHNPYAAFGSRGKAGVSLEQAFVRPTLAWQYAPGQALGIGLNFAWQHFEARGLGAFASASIAPDQLSNNGYHNSTGWGPSAGWLGRFGPFSLGLAWTARIHASRFKAYQGLFASHGSFDIPQRYGLGLAWQATRQLTLASDIQRIDYADVESIAQPIEALLAGRPLGSHDGPGFGWRSITSYKFGAIYQLSGPLKLRLGFSHAGNPVPTGQTFFNILAPAVAENHLSAGASWKVGHHGELSLAYTHAFSKHIRGRNSVPQPFGGGEADLQLGEDQLGLAYAYIY